MSKEYYGLVSGLQSLTPGKSPEQALVEFKDELSNQLEPVDYYQILLLFYPYDNQAVLDDLFRPEQNSHPLANLSAKERQEMLRSQLSDDLYFSRFLDEHRTLLDDPNEAELEKALTQHYYTFCAAEGQAFLQQWLSFEATLRNLTTLHLAKKLNLNLNEQLLEEALFSPEETQKLNASDLDKQHPHLKAYMEALATDSPLDRKKQLDQIRWNYLDEHTFFSYFGIERIIAYVLKLRDIDAWTTLDPNQGREAFEGFVNRIQQDLEKQLL